MKERNDFRAEFNAKVEAQREVRATMFELFAMEAGADGNLSKIGYWQQRALRLHARRKRIHIHVVPFQSHMAGYYIKRWGKRAAKHRRNGVAS